MFDTIFGYPGGAVLPLYDAIYSFEGIRHILGRHEQGCVHEAEGYAKSTGKIGVAVVTSGPGATNAITGIADAMSDSVPLLVFTGQVAKAGIGKDAFRKRILLGLRLLLPSTIIRFGRRQKFRVSLQKLFTLRRQVVLVQSLLICLRMSPLWKRTLSMTASCIYQAISRLLSLMNCRLRSIIKQISKAKKPVLLSGRGYQLCRGSSGIGCLCGALSDSSGH